MKRRSTVLQALRAEARATLHVLLLLLLIPVLHPVAEARALANGTASVICSTFGDRDAAPLALADDLPDCIACASVSAAVPPPVLPPPALRTPLQDAGADFPGDESAPARAASPLPPSCGPPVLA